MAEQPHQCQLQAAFACCHFLMVEVTRKGYGVEDGAVIPSMPVLGDGDMSQLQLDQAELGTKG